MSMRDRTNADDAVSERVEDVDPKAVHEDGEVHATTGGAALAGAATGATVGAIAGGPVAPLTAAIGAIGGAIVGAISERVMHSDNDHDHDRDRDPSYATTHTSETVLRDAEVVPTAAVAAAPGAMPTQTRRTDVDVDRVGDADLDRSGTATTHRRAESGETIRLREEELVAQKRMVEAGEVEIRKDIVAEQRTVEVPVSREEVVVERHAVERRPTGPINTADNAVIEVPLRQEQVSFDKRLVVTEEVEIGKQAVQSTERVSDTVRREVLEVETEGQVNVAGSGTTTRTDSDLDPRRS